LAETGEVAGVKVHKWTLKLAGPGLWWRGDVWYRTPLCGISMYLDDPKRFHHYWKRVTCRRCLALRKK
jgi:hypothetical protein